MFGDKKVKEDLQKTLELILNLTNEIKKSRETSEQQRAEVGKIEKSVKEIEKKRFKDKDVKAIANIINRTNAITKNEAAKLRKDLKELKWQARENVLKENMNELLKKIESIEKKVEAEPSKAVEELEKQREEAMEKKLNEISNELKTMQREFLGITKEKTKVDEKKAEELKDRMAAVERELSMAVNDLKIEGKNLDVFKQQAKNLAKNYMAITDSFVKLKKGIENGVLKEIGENTLEKITRDLNAIKTVLDRESTESRLILNELRRKAGRDEANEIIELIEVLHKEISQIENNARNKIDEKRLIGKIEDAQGAFALINEKIAEKMQSQNYRTRGLERSQEKLLKKHALLAERLAELQKFLAENAKTYPEIKKRIEEMALDLAINHELMAKSLSVSEKTREQLNDKIGKRDFNVIVSELKGIENLIDEALLKKEKGDKGDKKVFAESRVLNERVKMLKNDLSKALATMKAEHKDISFVGEQARNLAENYLRVMKKLSYFEKILCENPEINKAHIAELATVVNTLRMIEKELLTENKNILGLTNELKLKAGKTDLNQAVYLLNELNTDIEDIKDELGKKGFEGRMRETNDKLERINRDLIVLFEAVKKEDISEELFRKELERLSEAYITLMLRTENISRDAKEKKGVLKEAAAIEKLANKISSFEKIFKDKSGILSKEISEAKENAAIAEVKDLQAGTQRVINEIERVSRTLKRRSPTKREVLEIGEHLNGINKRLSQINSRISFEHTKTENFQKEVERLFVKHDEALKKVLALSVSIKEEQKIGRDVKQSAENLVRETEKIEDLLVRELEAQAIARTDANEERSTLERDLQDIIKTLNEPASIERLEAMKQMLKIIDKRIQKAEPSILRTRYLQERSRTANEKLNRIMEKLDKGSDESKKIYETIDEMHKVNEKLAGFEGDLFKVSKADFNEIKNGLEKMHNSFSSVAENLNKVDIKIDVFGKEMEEISSKQSLMQKRLLELEEKARRENVLPQRIKELFEENRKKMFDFEKKLHEESSFALERKNELGAVRKMLENKVEMLLKKLMESKNKDDLKAVLNEESAVERELKRSELKLLFIGDLESDLKSIKARAKAMLNEQESRQRKEISVIEKTVKDTRAVIEQGKEHEVEEILLHADREISKVQKMVLKLIERISAEGKELDFYERQIESLAREINFLEASVNDFERELPEIKDKAELLSLKKRLKRTKERLMKESSIVRMLEKAESRENILFDDDLRKLKEIAGEI